MDADSREIFYLKTTHRAEIDGEVAVKVESDSWKHFYKYITTGSGCYGPIEEFKNLRVHGQSSSNCFI